MHMGTIGQPDFSATLKLPSWKGRKVSGTLFLVPSGKMQMEMPDFTLSIASSMVFRPSFTSVRFRKRQ